jgi:DnaJ-class molecular chaperone
LLVAGTVRDYYSLLGVEQDATAEEIKRAYRKLARELHPDINPDSAAQDRFKEITAAYEVLSDPEKRRIVDLGGDPLSPGGGQGGAGNPFTGFGGFGDIFETFFGGGGGRGPRRSGWISASTTWRSGSPGRSQSRPRCCVKPATATAVPRGHHREPAIAVAAAASCSRCSARCSVRS